MNDTTKNRSGKHILKITLMAAALCVGFTDAHAERDGKLYPGSFCKAADVDNPAVGFDSKSGAITNSSKTNRLLVFCPIIKDLVQGSTWEKVVVTYSNPNPSIRIRCSVTIRNQFGDFVSTRNSYSDVSTTFGLMRIYGSGVKTSGATYTMNCELPPAPQTGIAQPAINFFQVTEKN